MLKKYKNKLFELIKESNIDVEKFGYSNIKEEYDTFILNYTNSELVFKIRTSSGSFERLDCRFSQFNPTYSLSDWLPSHWALFSEIEVVFKDWLQNHLVPYIDEQAGIDLWEEYKNGSKLLNLEKIDFDDKASFSLDEKKQIALSIGELKHLVEGKFSLNEKEMDLVNKRLDYLIEATARMNKFDWKSLVITSIIGIATTLSFDSQQGHELFNLFKQVFNVIPQLLITHPN